MRRRHELSLICGFVQKFAFLASYNDAQLQCEADHTRVMSLSLPTDVDSRDRKEIRFMVDDSHCCAVRVAAGVVMVWRSRAS